MTCISEIAKMNPSHIDHYSSPEVIRKESEGMEKSYLAHIAEDGREETVRSHLQDTARLAASFAAGFGAEEQGRLMGLAHDLGKYSASFQRHLRGAPNRVDHSTAGAVELWKRRQCPAAFAVAGHHGGLPDGGSRTDNCDQPTLLGRFNRAQMGKLADYSAWADEISLPQAQLPPYLQGRRVDPLDSMFYTRMLYSCLVDADFLATEAFMSGHNRTHTAFSMEALEQKLKAYTAPWFPPRGELNTLRCSILENCRQKGETEAPGLFTLTVPTGGGKTVSSLAFALAHARRHHLERIIYVIPYTSIIEQNAEVFRRILGPDAVLEHHSGLLYDLEGEANPKTIHMAQATENWDMPVVVTTAVQFFESLFSNRSSKCRKLHQLARSVIIFDEAQMLPIPMLRPCVYAISQLIAHFSASAVLCTATQPALMPIFREFIPEMTGTELCPPEIFASPVFQRVRFCREGKMSWEVLAAELNKQQQVLCIVNSRKGAQAVFEGLEGEGSFHLSTLMYPAHREQVLAEIRQRLRENQPCRVVSTSLIEAGVDVDFPAVYREEAGLDSILQAAGRCNREGKRKPEDSFVTVFQAETPPPPLFAAPIGAARNYLQNIDTISSRDTVTDYFYHLLELKGKAAQDQKQIIATIREEFFPFRQVAEAFQMIDQQTVTVYIPMGEGAELAEKIRSGERSRSLFRRLGKYAVSVYQQQFNALNASGALELLEDGSAILLDVGLYDGRMGLSPQTDSGKALFV